MRSCVSKADARILERSRCAGQEQEDTDRPNQIYERRAEEDGMRVRPWELRGEMGQIETKGNDTLSQRCEFWSQKVLSQVGGREALTKDHQQMIVLTDWMHQKHRRIDGYTLEKLQESCKAGSSLLLERIKNENRPQMRVLQDV